MSSDIDLAGLSDDELARVLCTGLRDHKLLVFKKQHLNHVHLLRVTGAIGDALPSMPAKYRVPGFPGLTVVSNIFENGQPIGLYDGDTEEEWHCDHSFLEVPPTISMLYSLVSACIGGATRFADTVSALRDLPADLRGRALATRALHSLGHLDATQRGQLPTKPLIEESCEVPEAWHPLVTRSRLGGEESLFLGRSVIRQLEGDDSDGDIVKALEVFCTQRRYVYEHLWRDDDLVVWDNLALLHTASPCHSSLHKRLLYRALAV